MTPEQLKARGAAMLARCPPVTVVFGAVTVTGARQSATSAKTYRPEGFTPDYAFTLIAMKDDFTAGLPAIGSAATSGVEVLRVAGIEDDPAGAMVRVDLAKTMSMRGY
jgi:hypothetical protein